MPALLGAIALSGVSLPLLVRAQALAVTEYAEDLSTPLSYHRVENLLGRGPDGRPRLNLFPERDPKHKTLVDLLAPGLGVDKPGVRDAVAEILARYPQQCLEKGVLSLDVEPIGDIETCVPGAKDNRRVTGLTFTGCLADDPKDCEYELSSDRGCNFGIGDFKDFLNGCRRSLDAAVEAGEPWDDRVYQQAAAFRALKVPQRARDYFSRKSLSAVPLPVTQEGPVPSQGTWQENRTTIATATQTAARTVANQAANDQIAQARHDSMALYLRGDAEAAYYLGCLSVAHIGRPPAALGGVPRETDASLRFDCAYYAESDYRAVYINNASDGPTAIKAFTLAAQSDHPKLAARANWNLAALALLDSRDEGGKEKARKAIAEAKRLEPGAFAP